jgi:hypothetical protein
VNSVTQENFYYPFGSMPIPEWRSPALLALSSEDLLRCRDDFGGICSYEFICALGDRDRALGVLPQGQARNAQGGGFFLDATGVGQSQCSFAEQAEKIEIAKWLNEAQLRMMFDAVLTKPLLSARMHGENDGHVLGNRIDRAKEPGELFHGIDVGRAVKRQNAKRLPTCIVAESKFLADARLLREGKEVKERVNHHIPHKMNRFSGSSFLEQIVDCIIFCHKKVFGQSIRKNSIYFFWHGAIKTSQASFHVGYGNSQFHRREGNGDRGIYVPNYQDEIGLLFEEDWFDAPEDFRRLLRMCPGTDSEINVWEGNAHLTKEDVREVFIVMLTCVDEQGLDFWMTLHLTEKGSDFGKIWTRSHDIQDFVASAHRSSFSLTQKV